MKMNILYNFHVCPPCSLFRLGFIVAFMECNLQFDSRFFLCVFSFSHVYVFCLVFQVTFICSSVSHRSMYFVYIISRLLLSDLLLCFSQICLLYLQFCEVSSTYFILVSLCTLFTIFQGQFYLLYFCVSPNSWYVIYNVEISVLVTLYSFDSVFLN